MHWTLGLYCWLIVGLAWWLLNLSSRRIWYCQSFRTRKLRVLSKYPTLWWQKTVDSGAQSLIAIKFATWSLYENIFQSSNEVIYTVVIIPDTFTNTVQSMCNTCYMVEVGYALQLLESPKHSYIYFIDYCWLLIEQNFKNLLRKLK